MLSHNRWDGFDEEELGHLRDILEYASWHTVDSELLAAASDFLEEIEAYLESIYG